MDALLARFGVVETKEGLVRSNAPIFALQLDRERELEGVRRAHLQCRAGSFVDRQPVINAPSMSVSFTIQTTTYGSERRGVPSAATTATFGEAIVNFPALTNAARTKEERRTTNERAIGILAK